MKQTQRQLFRRLVSRLLAYWPAASGMLFCMLSIGLLTPVLPWMLAPLLDHGITKKDYILPATFLPVAFFILVLLESIFSYGRSYLGGWLDATLQRDFRAEMAAHLLRLPFGRLREETQGRITARFMVFLPQMTGSLTHVCLALVQETVKIAGLTAMLFYLQWKLALIVFFVAPLVALTIRHLKRRMKGAAELSQQAATRGQNRLNETVQMLPIVKMQGGSSADGSSGRALGWLNDAFSRWRGAALRVNIVLAAGQPLSHILLGVPFALVVAYVVGALTSGAMSAGTVASFITAMVLLPPPVRNLTRAMGSWEMLMVAAAEIYSFLDMPEEADNGRREMQRAQGGVEFSQVSFAYTEGRQVLKDVSFKVAAGETVALVGKSGAGKTTLANLLARFYVPQEGVVRVDGVDISELTLSSLRRQLCLVTQQPLLFDDTVANNVAYPDVGCADIPRLRAALSAAACEFVFDMPAREQSRVGEGGALLSVGQRQRLALARAFYRDAPLVLLDEPTASLDGGTEAQIKTALRRLLAGRTAFIIAHHFTAIDFVDRIIVLDGGRVVAEGDAAHLRETCPLFAELYELQRLKK